MHRTPTHRFRSLVRAMSFVACVVACTPTAARSPAQKQIPGATTPHVALASSVENPTLASVPTTPVASAAATAARTYYVGYRGSEPLQLWLATTGRATFEGELSGLSSGATPVHAAYEAPLDSDEWPATGMAEYSGEIDALHFESGLVFVLWRGPNEEITDLPSDPPEHIVATSGANTVWLSKVGDEQAFTRHEELRQVLIEASGQRATTCGLRLRIQHVLDVRDELGAAAYYLADPCARSGAAPSDSYAGNERLFVATLDAEGRATHAVSLGEPTFDEESATLLRLELSGQAYFGVRRDWAKRAGGRAAATSDGWLLGVDGRNQLRVTANLGHWDINAPDTPSNDLANIYVADVDERPPDELMLERGGVISVYHAAKGRGNLVRVPTKLPRDSGELLKKSAVAWPN